VTGAIAMVANVEVCHIGAEVTRKVHQNSFGGLSAALSILTMGLVVIDKNYSYGRYVAEVVRSSGREIIAHTEE
jgi:hypothetical protein